MFVTHKNKHKKVLLNTVLCNIVPELRPPAD